MTIYMYTLTHTHTHTHTLTHSLTHTHTRIGARTKLKGFKRFLGGLDSDRDLTGENTVFTEHLDLEMMFHVATLLPFTPNDNQQVVVHWL